MKSTVMKKSRFAALLLILGVLPPTVRASAPLAFEVGQVSANVTDNGVKVPISATSNPGYGAGIITVTWDKSKLELTDVEYSENAPNNGSAPVKNSGSYRIAFGDHLAKTDFKGTGVFFTLTFRIPSGAAAGEIPVRITGKDVQDAKNAKDIEVEVSNGKVTLTNPVWTFDKTEKSITVTSAVKDTAPVVVASYTAEGKFLGSVFITKAGKTENVVKSGAGRVTILWLDKTGFKPQCAAEKIDLT